MDRDACLVCQPKHPLVLAGNSYFTCRACSPSAAPPAKTDTTGPQQTKLVFKPPQPA